jgi:hypothetical protein
MTIVRTRRRFVRWAVIDAQGHILSCHLSHRAAQRTVRFWIENGSFPTQEKVA